MFPCYILELPGNARPVADSPRCSAGVPFGVDGQLLHGSWSYGKSVPLIDNPSSTSFASSRGASCKLNKKPLNKIISPEQNSFYGIYSGLLMDCHCTQALGCWDVAVPQKCSRIATPPDPANRGEDGCGANEILSRNQATDATRWRTEALKCSVGV